MWESILKREYGNLMCTSYMFQTKARDSNLWESLVEVAAILAEGCHRNVENGENKLFWEDK